jgi:5-methylcytosine-specific restriction endonuclease McrA
VIGWYDGLDVLAMNEGRIVPADTVHHIIPVKDDPSLFWDPSNLLPVSRESHAYIHSKYDESATAKNDMILLLQSLRKPLSVL